MWNFCLFQLDLDMSLPRDVSLTEGSQLCKTLHYCILKLILSTYRELEVMVATGCTVHKLYLAMRHFGTGNE